MRHRYRIALLGLLLAGCGVQDVPTQSPVTSGAGQAAATAPGTAAPATVPRRGANPSALDRPYPEPALNGYPAPVAEGPPPAIPSTPATALPLDRIWFFGEQLLAVGGDGSALRFELPPESPFGGGHRHFYQLISRQAMPPVGIVQGAAEGAWYLIDPATGAGIDLPIASAVPPHGLAGADPNQFLLQRHPDDFAADADKLVLARVDLAAGAATALEVPEPRIAKGIVVAWRDSAAYVVARERPDGSGATLLWRVDLAATPPAATELYPLINYSAADQIRSLLQVQKAGADKATLINVVSGAEEELPIPVGTFSPDGALIAVLRPVPVDPSQEEPSPTPHEGGGLASLPVPRTSGKEELVVYDRAARTVRVLAADLPAGKQRIEAWFRSGAALLLTSTELNGAESRTEIATQIWLDGSPARQLEQEDPFGVTFTPLDRDHVLAMRHSELSAPAFGGAAPAFAPVPLANAGSIVYVP
ncbi:MAG TPA: hypothetical protein VGE07_28165 [Herpetosiphonaceae bacterium]